MQRDDTAVPLLGVLSTQSNGEVLSWKPDPLSFQQCVRVTYSGSIICLTEAENRISTSPAYEQISVFCAHAMRVAGHSFSLDGRHLGVTGSAGAFSPRGRLLAYSAAGAHDRLFCGYRRP